MGELTSKVSRKNLLENHCNRQCWVKSLEKVNILKFDVMIGTYVVYLIVTLTSNLKKVLKHNSSVVIVPNILLLYVLRYLTFLLAAKNHRY